MHEILRNLPSGSRVLDLGSRGGSFDASAYPLRTVQVDLEAPRRKERFVRADASSLPFPDDSFEAIVSNHSLEHFHRLSEALQEMGRVVKPDGSIYIAVPDASTLADRLYRWIGRGGGHVNAFRSRDDLIALVERHAGMRLAAARALMTSFGVFNRKNLGTRAPRKMILIGGGREGLLRWSSAALRLLDRRFHTRFSMYGWALYFGALREAVDQRPWSNVCVRCGAGTSSVWLEASGIVERRRLIRGYSCAQCGTWNIFTRDW